jgi:MSHA pilin protein MshC
MCPLPIRLPARRRGRGFTLIELIMVMVMIGILAVAVVPRLDIRAFKDVGFRDKARGALEFARKAAVAQRRNVQVSLASNNLTFLIDNVGPEAVGAGTYPRNLALPATDPACGGTTNQVCAPTGSNGVTITSTPSGALTFSPLGRPNAAITYTVTGASTFTLTVELETGLVH